jgi:hypothetical protein
MSATISPKQIDRMRSGNEAAGMIGSSRAGENPRK